MTHIHDHSRARARCGQNSLWTSLRISPTNLRTPIKRAKTKTHLRAWRWSPGSFWRRPWRPWLGTLASRRGGGGGGGAGRREGPCEPGPGLDRPAFAGARRAAAGVGVPVVSLPDFTSFSIFLVYQILPPGFPFCSFGFPPLSLLTSSFFWEVFKGHPKPEAQVSGSKSGPGFAPTSWRVRTSRPPSDLRALSRRCAWCPSQNSAQPADFEGH